MKVLVLTVSDRAFQGVYDDRSGPAIEAILRENLPDVIISRNIVPDDKVAIIRALAEGLANDCIITTGGTGLSPRDVTPEATEKFCDRTIPGIAEFLRAESFKQTPNAVWSRGAAGIKGTTIIINLPGSVKAVEFCTRLLIPLLPHALKMARGEGH
jgi:molybdopterin adenylyltransferase